MRVVHVDCPPEVIEDRRRRGVDLFDEVWEGEYHMAPVAGVRHQELAFRLTVVLDRVLSGRARVYPPLNVRESGTGTTNYRVPDIVIVGTERLDIVGESFVEGAPDAVVEVRSEGDETYEKLPFYAELGVEEVVVVDVKTSAPEVFRLRGGRYYPLAADRDGWLESAVLAIRLRAGEEEGVPRLLAAPTADPDRSEAL